MVIIGQHSTMNFRVTVGSLQEATDYDTAPFSGVIKDVTIDFPDGVMGFVEVFINLNGQKVFPDSRTGIAFSKSFPTFPLMVEIKTDDRIQVRLLNHDNTNSHTISVALNLEEIIKPEPTEVIIIGDQTAKPFEETPITKSSKNLNCCGPNGR